MVASKRYYDLDFSVGLAWGYSGNRGQLRNPFTFFSDEFKARGGGFSGRGGLVEFGKFFRGERVGIYGGIEYLTPVEGLRFKIEYDANDYRDEPSTTFDFDVQYPINVALEYEPWPWVNASFGFERGKTLMARLSISAPLNDLVGIPKLESPPPPLKPRPGGSATMPGATGFANKGESQGHDARVRAAQLGTAELVARLLDDLEAEGLEVLEISLVGPEARVIVWEKRSDLSPEVWSRAARKIASTLPVPVHRVTIASRHAGYDLLRISVATGELYRAHAIGADPMQLADASAANMDSAAPAAADDPSIVADRLFDGLEAEGFEVEAVELTHREATVFVSHRKYRQLPRAIGRAARIVANTVPASVEAITVVTMNGGVETNRVTLSRKDLEAVATLAVSPEEIWHKTSFQSPTGIPDTAFVNPDRYPALRWGLTPKLRQHIGRPNQFYRFQIWMMLSGELALARGLTLNGALGANLYNNFADLRSIPASRLEHVRSEIVNYLQKGENNLVSLALHYVFRPAQDFYARFSGGYLEEMFVGASGEVLYRPYGSRWAVGLELNQVWQREFEQRFGLLEEGNLAYEVFTGHLSTYYQMPFYNLFGAVHIGRYLAGDDGATFEISRRFESGVRVGAWATVTNVSAEEFGEGSFDKGFFVSIPFELFSTTSSRRTGVFSFRPLTRDGGQRLNVGKRLYGVTGDADLGELARDWSYLLD